MLDSEKKKNDQANEGKKRKRFTIFDYSECNYRVSKWEEKKKNYTDIETGSNFSKYSIFFFRNWTINKTIYFFIIFSYFQDKKKQTWKPIKI